MACECTKYVFRFEYTSKRVDYLALDRDGEWGFVDDEFHATISSGDSLRPAARRMSRLCPGIVDCYQECVDCRSIAWSLQLS